MYSFVSMDLATRMYIGYSFPVKSEMDAYRKALEMIGKICIDLKRIKLGKYYSDQNILENFNENTMISFIPKRNSRIRGRRNWKKIIERSMDDQMN
ncbi:MAG: transposase [Thermoplasmatales archaeon I-plasma]|nr:MAG: transposase [Thermoplasmatales archaeon I-plasma]